MLKILLEFFDCFVILFILVEVCEDSEEEEYRLIVG